MSAPVRHWTAWCVALVAAALAFCAPAAALTRDDADAVAALRTGDVFVSSRELGPEVASTIAQRLQEKVDAMRANGYEVKMAIVSPLNGDGAFGYARRLRTRLHFPGTLVVTTLNGPVGAAGERPPNALRAAFQADRVNALGSATERLSRAAEIAVPAPPGMPSASRVSIHGLNPQLTDALPADVLFRVFVSAMTQLVLDERTRLTTTETRLLRRLVRDRRYRNTRAADTMLHARHS